MNNTCWTCLFWNRLADEDGECRRHAPTPCGKYGQDCKFPPTKADCWCGDFQQLSFERPVDDVELP